MKLALYKCLENIDITGRNADGTPDRVFNKDKEYLFCYDEKKEQVFIICEVDEYYVSNIKYMEHGFKLVRVGNLDDFDLDELSQQRYKKLYRERLNYEE